MKTLTLALSLMAAANAAALGSAQLDGFTIAGGPETQQVNARTFDVWLYNMPYTNPAIIYTATLTAPVPLDSITFYFDNEPAGIGTGFCAHAGVAIACSPAGALVQSSFTLSSATPFSSILFDTAVFGTAGAYGEHARITVQAATTPTPEPGTGFLVSLGLCLYAGMALARKHFPRLTA